MKTLFIINPKAGFRKRPTRLIRKIRETYKQLHEDFEIWIWKAPGEIDAMLEKAKAEGFEAIIAVGGDGTVHAIGTRLIGTDIALGIIPSGSGNGYAAHLGYPKRQEDNIRQLPKLRPVKVDTGRFCGIPFLNVCGIGIDAEVAKKFASSKSRGLQSYIQHGSQVYFQYKSFPCTLTVDDNEPIPIAKTLVLDIANGVYWGAGAKIAPHSSITDGIMTAVFLETSSMVRTTNVLRQLFRGTLGHNKKVSMINGKKFTIQRDFAGRGQIDGDPVEEIPAKIEIEVVEASLNVLVMPGGHV
ncbi:MAG: hypothetical protein H6581_01480 [Bacteroidia bacterium]|nr:hypothetical protein [Bacteroidia bacterium]